MSGGGAVDQKSMAIRRGLGFDFGNEMRERQSMLCLFREPTTARDWNMQECRKREKRGRCRHC